MSQMKLIQAIINLDSWIQSWTDDEGGIHGYVIHHHRDCLTTIIPDTWTQSLILMAHSTLYKKTKEEKWLKVEVRWRPEEWWRWSDLPPYWLVEAVEKGELTKGIAAAVMDYLTENEIPFTGSGGKPAVTLIPVFERGVIAER